MTTMQDEDKQLILDRIEQLEANANKDSFSAVDVYRKYLNVINRLKIPVFETDPVVGNVGDIVCVGTTLKICTATTPTWTSLLTTTGDASSLTNLPPRLESSFTAGETLTLGNPVRLSTGDTTVHSQESTGNVHTISYSATYSGVADKFVVGALGAYITTVTLKLHKANSPSDNLVIQIVVDNSDAPTGTVKATINKPGSELTTSATNYDFSFTEFLNPGTYWIKITRSGLTDATNNYHITGISEAATSAARWANNDANWVTTNAARSYLIIESTDGTSGRIVKALATYKVTSRVIGFAKANITSGESGAVVLNGIVTGLSSLTTGAVYYLSDTGTLSTSAGTESKILGIALSSTTLLIQIT